MTDAPAGHAHAAPVNPLGLDGAEVIGAVIGFGESVGEHLAHTGETWEAFLLRLRLCLEAEPPWSPAGFMGRLFLGITLTEIGDSGDAIAHLQAAVRDHPRDDAAAFLLASVPLAHGRWEAAWPHWERRISITGFHLGTLPDATRWRGGDLEGRTLLVHCPDGDGDTLQFCRYVPLLAAQGARVILAVDARLIPVVRHLPGLAAVADNARPYPPHDAWVDRLSLPALTGTTPDTIPAAEGYLRADPHGAGLCRFALPKGGPKVGVVWGASLEHSDTAIRSMPAGFLAPILGVPGITFVNLQVGPWNAEGAHVGITANPACDLVDYGQTAAVVSNLDLVISVDTSTAHLAGAMGVPVWIMLPHQASWRWLREREDSPWYRSARLFRQRVPGDWEGVAEDVATALRQWVDRQPSHPA